jgi:DNA-binding transcriptional ArsR family regulator
MTQATLPTQDLLPLEFLEKASECLRVIAHPIRLRMVDILMRGDFPVHHIARLCAIPPQQACEHLRLLKGHGLLGSRRRGRLVYYHVIAPQLPGLLQCLAQNCPAASMPKTGPANQGANHG